MKALHPSTEPHYWLDPLYDADGVQRTSGVGVDGKEYPDPVPMSPPVDYEPPSTLEALIESVIHRRDLRAALAAADVESVDEADDFDVGDDDYDPRFEETLYEKYFEAKSKRAAVKAAQEANRIASVDSVSGPASLSSGQTPSAGAGIDSRVGGPGDNPSTAPESPRDARSGSRPEPSGTQSRSRRSSDSDSHEDKVS